MNWCIRTGKVTFSDTFTLIHTLCSHNSHHNPDLTPDTLTPIFQEGNGFEGLILLTQTSKNFQFFLKKANSTCQQSEKDVSSTCFYFGEIFILNITLLLFDRSPSNLAPGGDNELYVLKTTWKQSLIWHCLPPGSSEKVPHIVKIFSSVCHKADRQCQRQRMKRIYLLSTHNFYHDPQILTFRIIV